jgi:hypothetical protein
LFHLATVRAHAIEFGQHLLLNHLKLLALRLLLLLLLL